MRAVVLEVDERMIAERHRLGHLETLGVTVSRSGESLLVEGRLLDL